MLQSSTILYLSLCVVVASHHITKLSVPAIADPRNNVTLACQYDMEGDMLFSVKWFKDNYEFFRYMPGQWPACLPFQVPGVHLEEHPKCCSRTECAVTLVTPRSYSSGQYRCEVSTEAPTFKIVTKRSTMHVAGLPQSDPVILDAPEALKPGDELELTCTSDYSTPPAKIIWWINDEKAPLEFLELPTATVPDRNGLVSTSQVLRFPVNVSHFDMPDSKLQIICDAALPDWLPGPTVRRNTTIEISNIYDQSTAGANQFDVSLALALICVILQYDRS